MLLAKVNISVNIPSLQRKSSMKQSPDFVPHRAQAVALTTVSLKQSISLDVGYVLNYSSVNMRKSCIVYIKL